MPRICIALLQFSWLLLFTSVLSCRLPVPLLTSPFISMCRVHQREFFSSCYWNRHSDFCSPVHWLRTHFSLPLYPSTNHPQSVLSISVCPWTQLDTLHTSILFIQSTCICTNVLSYPDPVLHISSTHSTDTRSPPILSFVLLITDALFSCFTY